MAQRERSDSQQASVSSRLPVEEGVWVHCLFQIERQILSRKSSITEPLECGVKVPATKRDQTLGLERAQGGRAQWGAREALSIRK